jgi:hypothetical protein
MSQPTNWGVPRVGPSTPTDYAARDDDSLDALLSSNSGASEPAYKVRGTLWEDTTAGVLKKYNGTAWEVVSYYGDGGAQVYYISATQIGVRPREHGRLILDGVSRPVGTVTLANTLLSAGSAGYVYGYWTGSAFAAEISTTGPTLQSNGQMTKTGDTSRRLLGWVSRDTGGSFFDSPVYRGVLTWFHRRMKPIELSVSGSTAATVVPANIGTPAYFGCWRDEGAKFDLDGYITTNAADSVFSTVKADGVVGGENGERCALGEFRTLGGTKTLAVQTTESLHSVQAGMRTTGAATATATGLITGFING